MRGGIRRRHDLEDLQVQLRRHARELVLVREEVRLGIGRGHGLARHVPLHDAVGEDLLLEVAAVAFAQARLGGVLLAQLLLERLLAAHALLDLGDARIELLVDLGGRRGEALPLGLGHDQLLVDDLVQHLTAQRVDRRRVRLGLRVPEHQVELLLDVAREHRLVIDHRRDRVEGDVVGPRGLRLRGGLGRGLGRGGRGRGRASWAWPTRPCAARASVAAGFAGAAIACVGRDRATTARTSREARRMRLDKRDPPIEDGRRVRGRFVAGWDGVQSLGSIAIARPRAHPGYPIRARPHPHHPEVLRFRDSEPRPGLVVPRVTDRCARPLACAMVHGVTPSPALRDSSPSCCSCCTPGCSRSGSRPTGRIRGSG
jgi:hypothetical protein